MTVAPESPFGKALMLGIGDAPQLAAGIATKLDNALTQLGALACPAGTHRSQGRQIRNRPKISLRIDWSPLFELKMQP